jgi:hypothetical protein
LFHGFVAITLSNLIESFLFLGKVTTLAGGHDEGYDDGYGTNAHFFHPTGLAFDSVRKTVYVTDQVRLFIYSYFRYVHGYCNTAHVISTHHALWSWKVLVAKTTSFEIGVRACRLFFLIRLLVVTRLGYRAWREVVC